MCSNTRIGGQPAAHYWPSLHSRLDPCTIPTRVCMQARSLHAYMTVLYLYIFKNHIKLLTWSIVPFARLLRQLCDVAFWIPAHAQASLRAAYIDAFTATLSSKFGMKFFLGVKGSLRTFIRQLCNLAFWIPAHAHASLRAS